MRLLKILGIVTLSLAFLGCGSSTSSEEGNGHNGGPAEYNLSVSTNPSEAGSVEPASDTYQEDSEVTVEATSNKNWTFTSWSGDINSDENPLTFTISEDTELTANFKDKRSDYRMAISLNHTYEYDSRFHFYFGQSPSATRGYDDEIDAKAPPPPPPDAFHAYFETDSLELFDDFRSDTSTHTTWNLKYQIPESDDLIMTWEALNTKKAEGKLIMTDEDQSFEINMFEQTTDTIRGTTEGTLIINYTLDQ